MIPWNWSGWYGLFYDSTYERGDEIRKKVEAKSPVCGTYEVFQRSKKMHMCWSYQLISMLKKIMGDPVSILWITGLGVDESLSYEKAPVKI